MKQGLTLFGIQLLCKIRLATITTLYGEGYGANWSLNDWMTATAGELGELANLFKKVRRGDLKLSDPEVQRELRHEFADTFVYMMYMANKMEIDVEAAFKEKWNIIGERLDLKDGRID